MMQKDENYIDNRTNADGPSKTAKTTILSVAFKHFKDHFLKNDDTHNCQNYFPVCRNTYYPHILMKYQLVKFEPFFYLQNKYDFI